MDNFKALNEWYLFLEKMQKKREKIIRNNGDKELLELIDWVISKIPSEIDVELNSLVKEELSALISERNLENRKQSIEGYLDRWLEFNSLCKYFRDGKCSCGMDMTFCSDRCAFASNMVGSTKIIEKRGRKKREG